MPCFIWARIHNRGESAVTNAQVRYYWANPGVGFDRTTATLVGTANTSLAAGQDADVLCLAPWVPVFLNDGHECILAEAFHPTFDPLPPSVAFAVPTDRHVAQRNLSVLMASARSGFFMLAFEVHNPARKTLLAHVRLSRRSAASLRKEAAVLGFDVKGARGEFAALGLSTQRVRHEDEDAEGLTELEIELAPGERRGLTLMGHLRGRAAAVDVVHTLAERELGGLTALVLSEEAFEKGEAQS